MTKGTKSKWLCIRECYDNIRVWYVGQVVVAPEPPMKRHFERLYANQEANPVAVLRQKMEDMNLEWGEDWDLGRLAREIEVAEQFKARKAEKERKIKEQEIEEGGK